MSAGSRAALLIAAAALASGLADPAAAAVCDRRLTVELTPDVPDPRDTGFLSSLLSNEVDYHLVFRGWTDDTNIVIIHRSPRKNPEKRRGANAKSG